MTTSQPPQQSGRGGQSRDHQRHAERVERHLRDRSRRAAACHGAPHESQEDRRSVAQRPDRESDRVRDVPGGAPAATVWRRLATRRQYLSRPARRNSRLKSGLVSERTADALADPRPGVGRELEAPADYLEEFENVRARAPRLWCHLRSRAVRTNSTTVSAALSIDSGPTSRVS